MNDKAMIMISNWGDKLPDNAVLILREKLERLPEDKLSALSFIQLKDPIIGLVLGIFVGVFGIDRFYKGDIGLGIVKLLLCWATLGIWALIDLFFVWKGIKQDNLAKIQLNL